MQQCVLKLICALLCIAIPVTTSHSEPPNLSQVYELIKQYHDSGKYQREFANITSKAKQFVIDRANKKHIETQKLAIVLDIDETTLSNYDKMSARNFIATSDKLHAEIQEANAPALKPMLALYKAALKNGIAVFFVTGRREIERQATNKNLIQAGYTKWSGLFLRPNRDSQTSVIPFKSKMRAAIMKKGFTIIASIGDQCSDLLGGYAEKTFKLPNPYYYLP